MTSKPTKRDESLHILQHALGLDDYGQGKDGRHPLNTYRNHFVTGPECDNWSLCMAHVESGRMERHAPREIFGGHYCFTVTDAGREYVRDHSPRPPKLSRGKLRYLRFLRFSDARPDLTFREFLRMETRK